MNEWLFTFVVAVFTPSNGAQLIAGNALILQAEQSPCKEADKAIRAKFPEAFRDDDVRPTRPEDCSQRIQER